MKLRWPALLALAGVLLAACGDDAAVPSTSSGEDPPVILVTTSIWADIVGNLACDGSAVIETLIPDGSDPHRFELSLSDRAQLDDATIVIANGLDLEASLVDSLQAVADDGGTVVSVGELTDPLPYATGAETVDPHIWFDPTRVSALLPALGTTIAQSTGIEPTVIDGCLRTYRAELDALDRRVETLVEELRDERRVLVTNHDSLGYFADRYGFQVAGTVLPSPSGLAEGNPAALEELADEMVALDVPAVFSEQLHADDDAEALADRIGSIEVVELRTGSLGDDGTYVELVGSTADLVVDALR
jgi:zinc/manganese transport system substrate-binding protein